MIVQFNRNIQFTKLIKAEGRLREFNFRKVNGLHEELFISTDQPVPEWVKTNSTRFNEAIEEELRIS
jgi:hypothetical protein